MPRDRTFGPVQAGAPGPGVAGRCRVDCIPEKGGTDGANKKAGIQSQSTLVLEKGHLGSRRSDRAGRR